MINGFYKYSLTLVMALSTSSLALAVAAAPNLGTATATPTPGATSQTGASFPQNQTDQKNLRNIDAARRHQHDLELAQFEKEKSKVRSELQKAQTALAKEEAERQQLLSALRHKRDQVISTYIDKTEGDPLGKKRLEKFIREGYAKLTTDPLEGNPLSIEAAANPENVSELIRQSQSRIAKAASVKSHVTTAAQGIDEADKPAEESGAEAQVAGTPSPEQLKRDAELQKKLQAKLEDTLKKNPDALPVSAPVIIKHLNDLRDSVVIQKPEPNQAPTTGFHEKPPV